ncbi:MAG: hypothetical protein WC456_00735 [Patescibacteria group bacterium]
MKHIKPHYIVIIIILALAAAGIWLLATQQPRMILFYSDSCPHCQVVAEYIDQNGIRERFKFQELEVSRSQANATLLERKARQCDLDTAQGLGVPFFFDGEKCLMGDQDIIDYFKK